jgi:hypothetical protein
MFFIEEKNVGGSIGGILGKIFKGQNNSEKRKNLDDGKEVTALSDMECDEEEFPKDQDLPEFYSEVYLEYAIDSMWKMWRVSSKTEGKKQKKSVKELQDEEFEVIVNPLFGVRQFNRNFSALKKLTTLKEAEDHIHFYKTGFIVDVTTKTLSVEQTAVVDEDTVFPFSEEGKYIQKIKVEKPSVENK